MPITRSRGDTAGAELGGVQTVADGVSVDARYSASLYQPRETTTNPPAANVMPARPPGCRVGPVDSCGAINKAHADVECFADKNYFSVGSGCALSARGFVLFCSGELSAILRQGTLWPMLFAVMGLNRPHQRNLQGGVSSKNKGDHAPVQIEGRYIAFFLSVCLFAPSNFKRLMHAQYI